MMHQSLQSMQQSQVQELINPTLQTGKLRVKGGPGIYLKLGSLSELQRKTELVRYCPVLSMFLYRKNLPFYLNHVKCWEGRRLHPVAFILNTAHQNTKDSIGRNSSRPAADCSPGPLTFAKLAG